jgi:hypothetical protein
MGISTRELFKMKKWTLAIRSLSCGEHSAKVSLTDYDALRVIVNRENTTQEVYTYQLKANNSKYTLLKKIRE